MKIFVDTSAWLALNDRNDRHHKDSITKTATIKSKKIGLITSDYVIDESLTIIRFRVSHEAAVLFGESVFNSNIIQSVNIAEDDKYASCELFKRYRDRQFSFTDCTSFILMRRLKLDKCFTFDSHFSQMGFMFF